MPSRTASRLAILAGSAIVAASAGPPAVYWVSSPTPPGGTVLFAGAFGGNATVSVCAEGPACAAPSPLPALLAWESSTAVTYPAACAASGTCAFRICAPGGGGASGCTVVADPNAPDVWFAVSAPAVAAGTSFAPGPDSPAGDGATAVGAGGGALRVFGRSLAFGADGACVSAAALPAAVSSSVLLLTRTSAPIAAAAGTCFELRFELPPAALAGAAAFPDCVLRTPYGAFGLPLVVVPAPPPAALTVIDVDADAGGDVAAALAAAGAAPGDKRVVLGARAYALASPLDVPDHTVLVGAPGAPPGASALVFTLPAGGPSGRPAIAGGSHWALADLAVVVVAAPPATPAVAVPPGAVNFTAARVSVTLRQDNVSAAFRIEGRRWVVVDSALRQEGVCLWPPTSDKTNFQASTALYLLGADDGVFARNTLAWHCSAFDMDGSSRIIFEDNALTETDAGAFPHGNSVSFYTWARFPRSQGYSYARNAHSRPPDNNRSNWGFHEVRRR